MTEQQVNQDTVTCVTSTLKKNPGGMQEESERQGSLRALALYLERLIDCSKRHIYECFAHRSSADNLDFSVYRAIYRATRQKQLQNKRNSRFWRWLAIGSLRNRLGEIQTIPNGPLSPSPRGSNKRVFCASANMPAIDEVVQLCGVIQSLIRFLGPIDQQFFLLCIEGFSCDEIGDLTHWDADDVELRLQRIHARIQQLYGRRVPQLDTSTCY